MGIDHIEEVNKNIDHIEHIEKFNPFHDSRGRFSSSQGMKTYSANPKTKAGQMAISRSTAAGYGGVMNVHRESKGENIVQNDRWIRSGQKPNNSQLARAQANAPKSVAQARLNAHTNRVKGTMGATETGNAKHPRPNKKQQAAQAAAQAQKQPQKPQQQPQTQTQQTTPKQTPSQGLKSDVSRIQLTASQQIAIQPRGRNGQTTVTTKLCNDHDQARVAGKDISATFDANSMKGSARAIDKVAQAQGWNTSATVTNDWQTFQKAVVNRGQMMIRSVDGGGGMTDAGVCRATMTNGNAALGGGGGKVYGGGMYLVGANVTNKTGKALSQQIYNSQKHSYSYGQTQMLATVHPNAKIATPQQAKRLQSQFSSLNSSDRRKFDGDIGAFIASKGYDGAQWHVDDEPYITMYNKSAMIFYGGVSTAY